MMELSSYKDEIFDVFSISIVWNNLYGYQDFMLY